MKRASYPKRLRIGEMEYRLVFRKVLDRDPTCVGLCIPSKTKISLRTGLDADFRFETLLHEVLHAIEHEHDIKLKHKTVYGLANALSSFLQDNFYLRFRRR